MTFPRASARRHPRPHRPALPLTTMSLTPILLPTMPTMTTTSFNPRDPANDDANGNGNGNAGVAVSSSPRYSSDNVEQVLYPTT
ncbi:hypothetical protein BCR44DRAFT_1429973, partial [Catenaria anguillulae PL171]